MDQQILKSVVTDVLENTPYQPFLCLPMSAILYTVLKDIHGLDPNLVTGNLLYNGHHIFKQDFSISKAKDREFQYWSGHCWVEVDGLICDLSFFRTLYSDEFNKPFKHKLIEKFGEGKGCLIGPAADMPYLIYEPIEYLHDDLATGIIKGFEELLKRG